MNISHELIKDVAKQNRKSYPAWCSFKQPCSEKGGLFLPKPHPCRAGQDGKPVEVAVLLPSPRHGPRGQLGAWPQAVTPTAGVCVPVQEPPS